MIEYVLVTELDADHRSAMVASEDLAALLQRWWPTRRLVLLARIAELQAEVDASPYPLSARARSLAADLNVQLL